MSPGDRAQVVRPELGADVAQASDLAPGDFGVLAPISRSGHRWGRGRAVRRFLVVADLIALLIAFGTLQAIFGTSAPADRVSVDSELLLFLASLPVWWVLARAMGLYDRDAERPEHSTADDLIGITALVTTVVWLAFVASHVTQVAEPDLGKWIIFWAMAIVGVAAARSVARFAAHRSSAFLQPTVIVGTDRVARLIAQKLLQHREYGINLVGFVDDEPASRSTIDAAVPVLGTTDDLQEIISAHSIDRVILSVSESPRADMLQVIRELSYAGIHVDVVPRFHEVVGSQAAIHVVGGLPLLNLPTARLSRVSLASKRVLDLVVAILVLLLLAPILAPIALAIKIDTRGPVFFRQLRVGKNGRTFQIIKFRTMCFDADQRKHEFIHLNRHLRESGDTRMFKVHQDPRITRVGHFLRRFSLDEFPQLLNVVKGEMSLVGPRPLILDEDRYVEGWARRRLDLRPGITGLWQVHGRDGNPFSEMIELDYQYVTGWTLGRDLRLLAKTASVVLRPIDG